MKNRAGKFFNVFSALLLAVALIFAAFCTIAPTQVVAAWDGTVAASFASGSGTQSNPYTIKTENQMGYFLQQLSSGVTYEGLHIALGNDLDMTGGQWDTTSGFAGTFDGVGYTITAEQPLFDSISATGIVKRLIYVSTQTATHGLIARSNSGLIESCLVVGDVSADGRENYDDAGLIVTFNLKTGQVLNSGGIGSVYARGDDCSCYVGFVGENQGVIADCYSAAKVTGSAPGKYNYVRSDPIFGYGSGSSSGCYYDADLYTTGSTKGTGLTSQTMTSAAFADTMNGGTYAGMCWETSDTAGTFGGYPIPVACYEGIVHLSCTDEATSTYHTDTLNSGFSTSYSGTIYYTTDGSDPRTSSTRKTYTAGNEIQFTAQEGVVFVRSVLQYNGEYGAICTQKLVQLLGSGTQSDPYQIYYKSQLDIVRLDLSACYALENDLTFTEADFETDGIFPGGWAPLDEDDDGFTGTFIGNGHSLSGMVGNCGGLFNKNKGTIQDLRIVDHRLYRSGNCGAIANNNSGIIERCYTKSAFTLDDLPDNSNAYISQYSGGIVGYNSGGTVRCCWNDGLVYASSSYTYNYLYVGGIAGYSGTVESCLNTGMVVACSRKTTEYAYVGGIMGSGGTINNCRNQGAFYLDTALDYNQYLGGICGDWRTGSVNSCVADPLNYTIVGESDASRTAKYSISGNSSTKSYLLSDFLFASEYPELDFTDTWMMTGNGPIPAGIMGPDGTCLSTGWSHANHPICGTSCEHEQIHDTLSFSAWTGGNLSSGTYYMKSDLSLSQDVTISGNVRLCLNGHVLTLAEMCGLVVEEGASLELCDCQGCGGIVRGLRESSADCGILTNHGTMTIYSGIYAPDGEGFALSNNGTLTLYGGHFGLTLYNYGTTEIHNVVIDACYDSASNGIYNGEDATLTIHNCQVTSPGAALRNFGVASIYDGTLSATRDEDLIGSDAMYNNGTLSVYGGVISAANGNGIFNDTEGKLYFYAGSATSGGENRTTVAGIYNRGTLIVSGGTLSGYKGIYNGSAYTGTTTGGGVCKITGGTINGTWCAIHNSGNTWTEYGSDSAGVKKFNKASLTISSSPEIGKVILDYDDSFTFNYTGSEAIDLEINLDDFQAGGIVMRYQYNTANPTQTNLLNDGHFLVYGTSSATLVSTSFGAEGNNLNWDLTENGVLTISGVGEMENFGVSSYQPWHYNKTKIYITQVIVEPGVTSIGSAAFSCLEKLTTVTIAEGVTSLGSWAFECCDILEELYLPTSLTEIGRNIFNGCTATPELISYTGCIHQWNSISIDEQTLSFIPTCISNDNIDDGDCTTPVMCSICGGEDVPAQASHECGEWIIIVEPTCTKHGTKNRHCVNCDYTETQEIELDNHDYADSVTEPTCTEQGYTTHTCSNCGDAYTDTYVDALGHNFQTHVSNNDATCTEDGTKTAQCERCDATDTVTDTDSATGHTYGDWIVTTEPDCVNRGVEQHNCKDCSHFETRDVDPIGHNYSDTVTVPTCTEQGYTTHTCSNCGDVYTDTYVDALGHDFQTYVSDNNATCTTDGTKTAQCERCDANDTVTDPDSATGHTYGDWIVTVEPDCVSSGVEQHNCQKCSHFETRDVDPVGHNYSDTVIEPTCTEQGYTNHTCTACDNSYNDSYVKALEHNWGTWYQTKAPTLEEEGEERQDCSRCNHYTTRTVPALVHNYSSLITEPTCTEQGYTTHTCSNCGDVYTDTYVDALGHDFQTYVSNNDATCTEDGTKTAQCERCDATDTVTDLDSATGHTYGDWIVTINPGCTKNGAEQHNCQDCSHFEIRYVDALGHNYSDTVTEPTCTEQGFTTHTCSNCGDSYTDTYMDALGHDFQTYVSNNDATCTEDGTKTAQCEHCDATDTVTDTNSAADHTYGDWIVTIDPDCVNSGVEQHNCQNCSHFEIRYVDALGHNYSDTVTEPTCTEQGCTTHTCSNCDDVYTDTYVDALGHDFQIYVSDNNATCTADGTKTAQCERCDATDTVTDIDSATGHAYGDWIVTTEPDCVNRGVEQHNCQNCNHFETRDIDPIGHNYSDTVTEPTCTEQGYTSHTCSNCDDAYTDTYVDALGHNYSDTVTEPTCTEQGYTAHTCSNCDDAYTDTHVDALGHEFQNYVSDNNATYTADGTKTAKCERCDVTDTVTDVGSMLKLAQPKIAVSNRASDGKPTITWSSVEGATGYQVWRCNSKSGTYTKLAVTTASKLSVTHTSATVGNDYFYKVCAVNDSQVGEFSEIKGVWCDLAQPNITVTNRASDGKPTISWNAVEGATGYEVYYCGTSTGVYKKLYTATESKLSITHVGAAVGNDYFYKVRAIYSTNTSCNSAYSTVKGVWVDLGAPVIKVVNSVSSGKPVISWSKVTNASGYKVYCATGSSSAEYKLIYTTTNPDKISVTHTGAKAGVAYFYKVVATHSNSKCTSAYSTAKGVYCDLARPTLTVTLNSNNKPYLSWTAVNGASGYKVYCSTNGGTYKLIYTASSTKLNVTHVGAKAGNEYAYKVIALCSTNSKGNSSYSAVQSVSIK